MKDINIQLNELQEFLDFVNERDEHDKYDYLVVPDFNARNVKHILPYDLRIPRNWSDPNIFRIAAPIGMSLPFLNNSQK